MVPLCYLQNRFSAFFIANTILRGWGAEASLFGESQSGTARKRKSGRAGRQRRNAVDFRSYLQQERTSDGGADGAMRQAGATTPGPRRAPLHGGAGPAHLRERVQTGLGDVERARADADQRV